MNIYLLNDYERVNGVDGFILESGQPAPKHKHMFVRAPRAGYTSFQLIIEPDGASPVRVEALGAPRGAVVELYAEWFHEIADTLTPDCLIPVSEGAPLTIQPNLPAQIIAVWVDVYVPPECATGDARLKLCVSADAGVAEAQITLSVLDIAIPKTGRIVCDLNNYADAISDSYPSLRQNDKRYTDGSYIALEREYYVMAREHRCVFHNLPYRHSGKIPESFAPALAGEGKDMRVSDWSLYDEHFSPLLSGEAFANSRVSAKPLEYMYLPFHLGWPANYEKWGHKGYKTEYRRVLADFTRHFEEKGWYSTHFELFLNHKKDYRFFPYTADEIWYQHDEESLDKWYEVIEGAYEHTRVKFTPRIDSSNYFGVHHNNHRYADWFRLWVVGVGMFNWYPESISAFRQHGNTLWIYGDVLKDMRASLLSLYQWPITCLMTGADGFCVWNTTGAGDKPLTTPRSNGGELLFYPGEQFGIRAPLGCIRLKTLRNAMQVCELAAHANKSRVHAFVNKLFDKTGDQDWWREKPAFIDTPPRYWDFGESFSNATVKQLYLGRAPDMAGKFLNGILDLVNSPAPESKRAAFRYY